MIPCIENKCILLPVCKHKDYITCDQLQSYFIKLMKVYKFHFNESFDKLTEILPCLYKMEGNGRVFFNIQRGVIEYDQFELKHRTEREEQYTELLNYKGKVMTR